MGVVLSPCPFHHNIWMMRQLPPRFCGVHDAPGTGITGSVQVQKCLALVAQDERAAMAFYSGLHHHAGVPSAAKASVSSPACALSKEALSLLSRLQMHYYTACHYPLPTIHPSPCRSAHLDSRPGPYHASEMCDICLRC